MKLNLADMIKKSREDYDRRLVRESAPEARTQAEIDNYVNETDEVANILTALMTTHTGRVPQRHGVTTSDGKKFLENWERGEDKAPLSFAEALHSNDASIMFKRVISDMLVQPIETDYIGQTILSRTIRLDGARTAMFPAMGAIVAGDLSETGEYPEQQPSFTEHMLELKVQKAGLMLAVSEEVIEDSMWDVFGLYVTMASNACDRWKEEKIFKEALSKANTVFDNTMTGESEALTSGKDVDGALNGSVSFLDLMEIFGGVMTNGYTVTDLLMHPMCWVMLAKDPRLLFHLLTTGAYGQSVPVPGLDANSIQKNLPFGSVNVVVTPQMPFDYKRSIALNGVPQDPCNIGNIIALDRKASLLVLQRDDKHMEEFKAQTRDIHYLKVAERYAVGALDMGRGIAAIRNIRLVQNHESIFNVGMGVVS